MPAQANYYTMRRAFELQLNAPLLEGLATIGRFDGKTPSLVCATDTEQLVIHRAERLDVVSRNEDDSPTQATVPSVRTLNLRNPPTALAVGSVRETANRTGADALYIGSATALVAYDVDRNSEYFYKHVDDGVNAITCGVMNMAKSSKNSAKSLPMTIVGGNCAISGFDEAGEEVFWTVTSDQVTALILMPWGANKNARSGVTNATAACRQQMSLVAASEDFELRVFDGEVAIASMMEVDKVSQLVYSGVPGRFAYLSVNGSVGVYDQTERVWRAKGKHRPVSAAFCDVDFDGVPELVVGWSNGRVEVRGDDTEKRGVLFRETYAAPVSAVLAYDYRQNGQPLPIVCTVDGAVRGLQLAGAKVGGEQEEVLRCLGAFRLDTLQRERGALVAELASVEEQLSRQRKGDTDVTLPGAGTVVRHELLPNAKTKQLDIVFTVHNGHYDTIIQGCILHSETLFPNEEYVFFTADDPSRSLVCSVDFERCADVSVAASVMVGASNAENYQVHEVSFVIPSFIMCRLLETDSAQQFCEPTSYVILQLPGNFEFSSLHAWLESTFNIKDVPDTTEDFSVRLVDTRSGGGLVIKGRVMHHELQVCGETMEICGDVVENLASTGMVTGDAGATCYFPAEFKELQAALERVVELNVVRAKLTSNMADCAANVEPLLIHAENSRLMSDITNMRRFYAELYNINRELIGDNMKRYSNYCELKVFLKTVNMYILKTARFRIGQLRTQFVSDCREAVKAGDMHALLSLIRTGRK